MKTTAPNSENLEVRSEKRDQDSSFSIPNSYFSLHPPALVPKLRFPEFRGEGGWDADELGKVADFVNEKVPVEAVALENYVSTENILPDFRGIARASKLPTTGSATRYRPNDNLVSNIRPYLRKVWVADKEGGASNDVIVIRAKQRLLPQYFSCLLKNDAFIDYVMTGAKGVKMPRGDIGSMKEYPTLYPSKPEQQKIAECLSSVDELMAAQARKVDALKTHKKGLMQQLFPREGETQPRLRFPEFQNAGEWARISIQEMIDQKFILGHLDGNHGELYPKSEEFSSNKDGIPYITANDFINGTVEFSRCKRLPIERARLFKKGVAKDGDILFAHNATVGPVAKLSTFDEFVILSTTATYFRCNAKQLSNDFLKSALSSPDFVAQYSRVMSQSTRNQVPITTQRKLQLHLPKLPEQHRIAMCLSSLDALITAETQKLEALKTHKRGLMQQLFPSPEESQ